MICVHCHQPIEKAGALQGRAMLMMHDDLQEEYVHTTTGYFSCDRYPDWTWEAPPIRHEHPPTFATPSGSEP